MGARAEDAFLLLHLHLSPSALLSLSRGSPAPASSHYVEMQQVTVGEPTCEYAVRRRQRHPGQYIYRINHHSSRAVQYNGATNWLLAPLSPQIRVGKVAGARRFVEHLAGAARQRALGRCSSDDGGARGPAGLGGDGAKAQRRGDRPGKRLNGRWGARAAAAARPDGGGSGRVRPCLVHKS
uniref:Uncharacterized protein n=1 Tax=Aegilops speltoides TaxID=4573 RepID=C1KV18_AEGSP|nr:hypothetical protein [Aegilops speltoides]